MRSVLVLLLGSVLLSGCGERSESAELDIAAAMPVESTVFSQEGLPGPWTRHGANREQFVLDSKSCRAQSSAARSAADSGDGAEAAYRAFLECMKGLRWTRGYRPVDVPPAPV